MKLFIKPLHIILFITLISCSFDHQSKNKRDVASLDLQNLDLSPGRVGEVKIIQENMLKYLIAATHSDRETKIKLYYDASEYLNRHINALYQNIRTEKEGANKFIEIKPAPHWSISDEINYLNKETAALPIPKATIDLVEILHAITPLYQNLNQANREYLKEQYGVVANKLPPIAHDLHPTFNELEELLDSTTDNDEERILKVISTFEDKLQKHEKMIRNIGTTMISSGQVDMRNSQIRFTLTFMDYYFNHLPDEVIKTILSELITAGPKLDQDKIVKVIFQNTGPGLGKVLQQIGKEKGVGGDLARLMEILESTGKEVPIHLVQKIVSEDRGGYEIKSIHPKPLGTGTIAQVNRAVIWDENIEKEIALRFPKPGVQERCKQDIAILRSFVPANEVMLKREGFEDTKILESLIDSIVKFLDEETNISIAVERQRLADEIYTRSVKIHTPGDYNLLEMKVPKVYLPPSGKSNLHVQEFVTGGVKFVDLKDSNAKKIVAEEMLRMWFQEALFKSGFLNADLHQGNFRVVLVEENNKIKILLYDFGLSSVLTKEEQRSFLLVGAGAELKSPKIITDGLMASIGSNDKELRKRLLKDVTEEMKLKPNKRPEDWVAWSVFKNYLVSDKLGALARGSLLLRQLPESIGEAEMFKEIVTKSAISNLVSSIVDLTYDYPLTKIDLLKIAGTKLKNSCVELFRNFFK